MESGDLAFADIRQRVDAASPVCCRIGWFGDGGHFAVVVGWRVAPSGKQYIDVADPIWAENEVAYDGFPSSYQTGGDWTHTYFTGAATAGGAVVASASAPDPDTLGA